jgi:hypothetical protein
MKFRHCKELMGVEMKSAITTTTTTTTNNNPKPNNTNNVSFTYIDILILNIFLLEQVGDGM